jgi:Cft2 family RNA processing exonuclease
MQELLAILYDAHKAGKLADAPIFCSGLGMSLVDSFDEIARKTNLIQFRRKILQELKVKPLKKIPKPGSRPPEPSIFLVSSGMVVENTPSYKTAAALLGDPHSTLCFVGYCDPESPGGELLEAHQGDSFLFSALDYTTPVRAHIERFDLSGHADRNELLHFAQKLDPRTIVLTHGDPEARNWFFDELIAFSPKTRIIDPTPGESTNL